MYIFKGHQPAQLALGDISAGPSRRIPTRSIFIIHATRDQLIIVLPITVLMCRPLQGVILQWNPGIGMGMVIPVRLIIHAAPITTLHRAWAVSHAMKQIIHRRLSPYACPPDIYLYRASLNSIQPKDTLSTSTIDICNTGEDISSIGRLKKFIPVGCLIERHQSLDHGSIQHRRQPLLRYTELQ